MSQKTVRHETKQTSVFATVYQPDVIGGGVCWYKGL